MRLKKITAVVLACVLATQANAVTMQQLFDDVNANGNVSNPAALQGQTMNMYTGGSMFMRMPTRTYNLAMVTPPSWNAGCGGIDLFMGGFSFINKDQFVAMLKNIGSNALGYGFKLALQNLCPTCDNVMQALQATANQINRLNIDSCETAKGLVNASVPESWSRGRQNAAKNFGVDSNIFENITDAWTNVMNNEDKANQTVNQVASSNPAASDDLPRGNVVWKALKKLDGIDDEYRMILMSMVGTTIFSTNGNRTKPLFVPKKDITVQQLVGKQDTSPTLDLPIWRCDTTSEDGCLNPYNSTSSSNTRSFRYMVRTKMWDITDKIATRAAHPDVDAIWKFLNVTDLPVYKMLAVSTTLNNTALADNLVNRYQDLIAAKYAEVYIQRAVADLNAALAKYVATASDPAVAQELNKVYPELEKLRNDARSVLATAYTQTISTYDIAQEVHYMERALNANLSQTLRNSLAFGKSLR
ncbi:MAG: conjugal transfer protein TraH [Zoogloea oleivorans]|jgi:conjugative transfer pilus assembly protein TraH|uniref:conjugal transfer protein TraH n=1 Tax=Zoogloea oleivorans TaxID=1552750 RepID=UPI002A35876D|nr:conjugal transfer protein TraH [Zoogloea oleivorans]MDY0038355.1 conjugal transfer protein TraH [Zoogloea oleivorans]